MIILTQSMIFPKAKPDLHHRPQTQLSLKETKQDINISTGSGVGRPLQPYCTVRYRNQPSWRISGADDEDDYEDEGDDEDDEGKEDDEEGDEGDDDEDKDENLAL